MATALMEFIVFWGGMDVLKNNEYFEEEWIY